jgi:predicted thioesterase
MYLVTEFPALKPGLEGRMERTIDSPLLTRHMGGAGLFSTPAMILLMELTAHGTVEPYLPAGHTTVGYEVCVRHVAPARAGETVVVSSRLKEVTGNRLLFDVECSKEDMLVGSGTHKRAVLPNLSED